jgi:radical SAM-linked protein
MLILRWRVVPVADQQFRLRINYQKLGRLSHLSHLEIVRAMERLVRRAQLPYAITQGFSAHMKHAFGPALPVGTGGLDEYLDVWLNDYLPAPELLTRLQAVTVIDLPVVSVAYIAANTPSLQVSHVISTYELLLDVGDNSWQAVDDSLMHLIALGSLEVERKGKLKLFDLGHYLVERPRVSEAGERIVHLDLSLRSSASGSLRPETLLTAAFKAPEGIRIVSITRVRLSEE